MAPLLGGNWLSRGEVPEGVPQQASLDGHDDVVVELIPGNKAR